MKRIIRLTENDIHRMVKNSVARILRENKDFGDYTEPHYADKDGNEIRRNPKNGHFKSFDKRYISQKPKRNNKPTKDFGDYTEPHYGDNDGNEIRRNPKNGHFKSFSK